MNLPSKTIFLKSFKAQFTYADLNKFIVFFESYLTQQPIKKSEPLGIMSSSCDEYIFIVAACWKLGIPFVCFNPDEQKQIRQNQIQALNPAIIFTDDNILERQSPITVAIDELSKEKWMNNNSVRTEDRNLDKNLSEENIFAYFFTSGTTSSPKIVPLKRRQLLTAAKASTNNIKLNKNNFWLLCLPLHHISGVSIILRSLVYKSAVYRTEFSENGISKQLCNDQSIKAASLVPTMFRRLIDQPNFNPHRHLNILLGGGPVYASLLKNAAERNIHVVTSYGMTETCAQIAALPVNGPSPEEKNVGSIFEPNKIEIRNTANKNCKTGQPGSIWLKGPQVFDGYVSENKQNRFDNNGWFNTGDFGYLDQKERLHIETRRTDLIVTGGENVSPIEVESALLALNGIKEAAVTGLPDEEWGQIVAAAVIAAIKIPADEIKKRLRQKLSGYKIPKKVMFVDELPRTQSGKIKRNKVKLLFNH